MTEEEKEFLKSMTKFFKIISIVFDDDTIDFNKGDEDGIALCSDYPKGLKFEELKRNKQYTLKELGLE